MASSSMNIDDICYEYDVFLSFRGDDTRNNFTSHLYDALHRQDVKVFIDNEIDRGEEITSTIERVIENAKLSIIIFSPDYASSTFCLDELVKIMNCREFKRQIVFPIFYKMEPKEDAYQEAFARYKAVIKRKKRRRAETIKQQLEKVKRWKSAFRKALNLGGWCIGPESNEAKCIKKITRKVLRRLKCESRCQSKGEELMCTSIVGKIAEDIFEKIWECLINDTISRVGIHGMGGVGKTTIATRINDELLAGTNSFTHVFWVTVSKDLSISKLQNDISKMIKLDLSTEDDERKRAAKLRKRLKPEKFVLILDDIWEAFQIEDMGIPPLNSGQKLLLTSRSRRVCEEMECQPIEVNPLSQNEALDLFMKESKYKINDSPELRGVIHSIVRECAGLPLAIVVIARRMRGLVEISEWRNVLRKLKKPWEGKNHGIEEKIFKPLRYSYDSLPDYQYRQCFLYYSLFPEDYVQSLDEFIEYLIGEGLIGKLGSRQAEFDTGKTIINELINMSLLELITYLDGTKHVKMHDVIRNMAHILITENSKAQDASKLQSLSEETERCFNFKSVLILRDSILEGAVPNSTLDDSKLSTLIFHGVKRLPSYFFANIQNLVVLDISYEELLMVLPDSISSLGSLRVLLLQGCYSLEYIPSLDGLKLLRHLDLGGTNLKEIPKGMEKLINLSVLKLSWFGSFPDAVFPGAVFLKMLPHLQSLIIEDVEVEPDVLISLSNLETLKIAFYNLEALNSYLKSGHWHRLEGYNIVYRREKGSKCPFDMLWCEDDYKKVMCFEKLRVVGGKKGKTDMVLPYNMQHLALEEWNGPMVDVLTNSTFDNIEVLQIHGCGGGMHLFTPGLAQRVLFDVEKLHIGDYEYDEVLEEIISAKEEFMGEINTTIELPKLKSLTKLRNLRSIYKGRMVCPSLEYIHVEDCGKLERLPFCTEVERNRQNPIKLIVSNSLWPNLWWDSLQCDHPSAKSIYQIESL